jgi:hypothetical protein
LTTETVSPAEALVNAIKQRAHWRVLLEPTTYVQRYPQRKAARDAVRESVVHLRGWDFPHFDEGTRHGGNGPIDAGWEHWKDMEAWRIYVSGQFIHYLSLREDSDRRAFPQGHQPFLDMVATVYQLTELFEFASRLVATADFEPSVSVEIQLAGMEGRQLVSGEPLQVMLREYVCPKPAIRIRRTLPVDELRLRPAQQAATAAAELFEWFGFKPHMSVTTDIQAELLRRG